MYWQCNVKTLCSTRREEGGNYIPPPVHNGVICEKTRLAYVLQYFCGASAYDLMSKFNIFQIKVMKSDLFIVEAMNQLDWFRIQYPANHEKQQLIADEFAAVSRVGFPNCAGCIDGVLIWIEKPSQAEAKRAGLGRKKFFCGQKHKFGLNCQAVLNVRGGNFGYIHYSWGSFLQFPCIWSKQTVFLTTVWSNERGACFVWW